jgi:hypothetical protein
MDGLLSFFEDLLVFTGGLFVSLIWLVIFGAIAIEAWDAISSKFNDKEEL